jgi:hypothetical protein
VTLSKRIHAIAREREMPISHVLRDALEVMFPPPVTVAESLAALSMSKEDLATQIGGM